MACHYKDGSCSDPQKRCNGCKSDFALTEIAYKAVIDAEIFGEAEIEEAALRSALNMGAPDSFGCGYCGLWFLPYDFAAHIEDCHAKS